MARLEQGVSLVELLVVMALMGVAFTMTAAYLHTEDTSPRTGGVLLEGFIRHSRAKAMATTSSYRIAPVDARTVQAETGPTCGGGTWIVDPDLRLELPAGMSLADTAWSLCFSSRGIATASQILTVNNSNHAAPGRVEVLRGGMTRILP
jgi:prepilin-type N-terminal cleavage/methylation domain-containing protein